MWSVQRVVYTVHCIVCCGQCEVYTVNCIVCNEQCVVCSVHIIMCSVHCVEYTVQCAMYSMWCDYLEVGEHALRLCEDCLVVGNLDQQISYSLSFYDLFLIYQYF